MVITPIIEANPTPNIAIRKPLEVLFPPSNKIYTMLPIKNATTPVKLYEYLFFSHSLLSSSS